MLDRNLLAKRSDDRFLALWGQFAVAAALSVVVLAVTRDLPSATWGPAAVTGLVHVPLHQASTAWAYNHGYFSVAYPIARGSGAVLSALGGVVLLDDSLGVWSVIAIVTVAAGMALLAFGAHRPQISLALVVGLTIGIYAVNDGRRRPRVRRNIAFAMFALHRGVDDDPGCRHPAGGPMIATDHAGWRRYALTGAVSPAATSSSLWQSVAPRSATSRRCRESSVLMAAVLGARFLAEAQAHRRTVAAAVILGGLVLLIATG